MDRKSPEELVKTHGNTELGKGSRKSKESKWTKDAQEEVNGILESTSNVIKEPMAILNHWGKNKRQAQRGPARLGQIISQQEWQNGMTGNDSNKRVGCKKTKPTIK